MSAAQAMWYGVNAAVTSSQIEPGESLRVATVDLVVGLVAGDIGRTIRFRVVMDRHEDLRVQVDGDLRRVAIVVL